MALKTRRGHNYVVCTHAVEYRYYGSLDQDSIRKVGFKSRPLIDMEWFKLADKIKEVITDQLLLCLVDHDLATISILSGITYKH